MLAITTILLVAMFAPLVPVREVESRMDNVTGTITWKTVWLFGLTSSSRVNVSPLETRLKRSGIPWTPSWRFLHNTPRNVFGGATCHECGRAPATYQILPLLNQFAAGASDAELHEFVRVMQSGTDDEKKAAVDAVADKVLAAASSS